MQGVENEGLDKLPHKGRIKVQSILRFTSNLSDLLGVSYHSSILSFAEQLNKAVAGMKRSLICHLGNYTNIIKGSQHFFSVFSRA